MDSIMGTIVPGTYSISETEIEVDRWGKFRVINKCLVKTRSGGFKYVSIRPRQTDNGTITLSEDVAESVEDVADIVDDGDSTKIENMNMEDIFKGMIKEIPEKKESEAVNDGTK